MKTVRVDTRGKRKVRILMKGKDKKNLYRLCSAVMSLSMAATSFVLPVAAAGEEAADTPKASVSLYPEPQEITYDSDEGMSLEGPVDLVVHGNIDDDTLRVVDEILKGEGIEYTKVETANPDHAKILISSGEDHCDECGAITSEALEEEQGYILYSDNDTNEKGEIRIIGADEAGAWNGVLSLEQLLDQKNEEGKFAEVLVADYPDIKLRGFVEGFYGFPWSFENRCSVIQQASRFKINEYIYAPKDDPYHKDKWRELYPEKEAEQIKTLVELCNENHIEFVWCAHPGNGYNYTTDDDYNTLINKIEQLYSLGVRRFGLSYDDLDGSAHGADQAALINRVQNYLQTKYSDVGSMFTVGQRYTDGWGASWDGYLKPFLNGLDKSVIAMWTGKNTGGNCDADSFDGPKKMVGYDQEMAFWFNFPVNDMAFGRLIMGTLNNVDPNLKSLRGFFMNPMNQAQASKVAIYQGADYSWNIHDYDYNRSWDRALKEVLPGHSEALKRFADNVAYHSFENIHHDESELMKPYLDSLTDAIATGENLAENVAAVKAKFVEMQTDADELLAMNDTLLLDEITQHVQAYKNLGEAGEKAMEGFECAMKADVAGMKEATAAMNAKISEANTHRIPALNRSNAEYTVQVEVCTQVIRPYLSQCADRMGLVLKRALAPAVENKVISTDGEATGTVELTGGNYKGTLSGTVASQGYIGMALEKAVKVSALDVTGANSLRVEYSRNGIDWKTYTGEEGNMDVAYVRLVNDGTEAVTVDGAEITATVVYKAAEEIEATTDMGRYQSNYPRYMVDGNFDTRFYSDAGATVGNYVQLDLGAPVAVHDLSIWFGGNPKGVASGLDGFQGSICEVSADGVTWKQIGDEYKVENTEQYKQVTVNGKIMAQLDWNAEGEVARYVRVKSTVTHDNWCQVYEFQVNNHAPEAGDDRVILTESNTNGIGDYLYDQDVNTAFEVASPVKGDYVVYDMTTVTSVKELALIQNSVSNAKVSVQSYDGAWTEIGTLDETSKTLPVNGLIRAVRLDFEEGAPASIAELVVRPTDTLLDGAITAPGEAPEIKEANKMLLNLAIAEADRLNNEETLAGVNELVVKNFRESLAAAKEISANRYATQAQVNDAWTSLVNAIHMLDFKTDKTELQALIDQCEAMNPADYGDSEAKTEFLAALDYAKKVNEDPAALTDQSIKEAIDRLSAAREALLAEQKLDTTMLAWLLAQTEDMDETQYTASTLAALNEKQEQARNVLKDPVSQVQINDAMNELHTAWLDLRLQASEELLKALNEASAAIAAFSLDEMPVALKARAADLQTTYKNFMLQPEQPKDEAEDLLAQMNVLIDDLNKAQDDLKKPDTGKDPEPEKKPDTGKEENVKPADDKKVEEAAKPSTKPATNKSVKTAASAGLMTAAVSGLAALAGLVSLKKRRK